VEEFEMFRGLLATGFTLAWATALVGEPPTLTSQGSVAISKNAFTGALSPNGKLVTYSDGPNLDNLDLIVHEVNSGKEVARMKKCGLASSAFSSDGRVLACVLDGGSIQVYNTRTWERTVEVKIEDDLWGRNSLFRAVSPKGELIAFRASKGRVAVWDIENKRVSALFGDYKDELFGVEFSPDGKQLAVVTGIDSRRRDEMVGEGDVSVWDLATSKRIFQDKVTGSLLRVAFSPDGTKVVAGGTHGTAVWDVKEKKRVATLRQDEEKWVLAVRFSPSGNHIVTIDGARITVWDAMTGKVQVNLSSGLSFVSSMQISSDTKRLFLTSQRVIRFYDLQLE
jgi:WD40 repeat protein